MATVVSRDLIKDYYRACISRDSERIAPLLHDDVEWTCTGPVDLLQFCGTARGKSAVLDTIVRIGPTVMKVKTMEIDEIVIEGSRAATFMRLTAVYVRTGRTVSYRCAQYLRFRDGKLLQFRALIDSLDAAEQALGRPIELATGAATPQAQGDVFAI